MANVPEQQCATAPENDVNLKSGYAILATGTNSQGNEYVKYYGPGGSHAYCYHNTNGTYYYKGSEGKGYFECPNGWKQFTTPDGTRIVL